MDPSLNEEVTINRRVLIDLMSLAMPSPEGLRLVETFSERLMALMEDHLENLGDLEDKPISDLLDESFGASLTALGY